MTCYKDFYVSQYDLTMIPKNGIFSDRSFSDDRQKEIEVSSHRYTHCLQLNCEHFLQLTGLRLST